MTEAGSGNPTDGSYARWKRAKGGGWILRIVFDPAAAPSVGTGKGETVVVPVYGEAGMSNRTMARLRLTSSVFVRYERLHAFAEVVDYGPPPL